MRTNAGAPDFRSNVEAAYAVEQAAFDAGVPCPEPVPVDGRCLAAVGPDLVRVHRWVEGRPVSPADWLEQAGALAARIHAVAEHVEAPLDDRPRGADGWADLAGHPDVPTALAARLHRHAGDLAELEERTAATGLHVTHAGTHGDLDPKNTLAHGTTLLALDWDAAGPRSIVREAVAVGLDWSTDVAGFARVLTAYAATGGSSRPSPGSSARWVAATTGWLAHQRRTAPVDTPHGAALGAAEATLAARPAAPPARVAPRAPRRPGRPGRRTLSDAAFRVRLSVVRLHAGLMDTFPLLLTLALVLAVGLALGAVIGVLWARSRPGRRHGRRRAAAARRRPRRRPGRARAPPGPAQRPGPRPGRLAGPAAPAGGRHAPLHRDAAARDDHPRHGAAQAAGARAVGRAAPAPHGRAGRARRPLRLRRAGRASTTGGCVPTSSSRSPADARSRSTPRPRSPRSSTSPAPTTPPSTTGPSPGSASTCASTSPTSGRGATGRRCRRTPEFVVLFLPGEAILQAGLQAVPDLLEQAAARNVVLATPSTLIALLRTVAQGWQHEVLNAQAHQVQRLGPGAPRPARLDGRPPRQGRPLAQRQRRRLQPGDGLAGGPRAGLRTPLRRPRRHLRASWRPRARWRPCRAPAARPPSWPRPGRRRPRVRTRDEPTLDDLLAGQHDDGTGAPRRRAPEIGPRLSVVTLAEGWWQVGREPGRQVVLPRRRPHPHRGRHRRAPRGPPDALLRPLLHGALPGPGGARATAGLLPRRAAARRC